MYSSEKNPGINWKDLIVKAIFFVIFILILMWLFPKVPNMTAFYSNVFRENISYMQDAAKSYYTNERLPKNVGDMAEMTLQDMIDKNLIIPFVDKDGNPCDTYESYVQVTKESTEEYSLKINLVCDTESSYIIEPLGCYDYCESGKCDVEEVAQTAIEYQFRQAYTTNKTTYTCPSGYTLSGTTCYKNLVDSKVDATANYKTTDVVVDALKNTTGSYLVYADPKVDVNSSYTCPSGYTKDGNTCYKSVSATAKSETVSYTCPSGYTRSGSKCIKTTVSKVDATKTTNKVHKYGPYSTAPSGYMCSTSTQYVCTSSSNCPGYVTIYTNCYKNQTTYTCPSGYTLSGTKCTKTTTSTINATINTKPATYTCPDGYTLKGKLCYVYTSADIDYDYTYTCPSGYIKSGSGSSTQCYQYIKGTTNYYCANAGYSLINTKCYGTEKTFTGYTCPSGYILDGSTCFKKNTTTVAATKKTNKVTGYNYKWSRSESLEGWERTGKTRTVEI